MDFWITVNVLVVLCIGISVGLWLPRRNPRDFRSTDRPTDDRRTTLVACSDNDISAKISKLQTLMGLKTFMDASVMVAKHAAFYGTEGDIVTLHTNIDRVAMERAVDELLVKYKR